jgi:hypothetical protein
VDGLKRFSVLDGEEREVVALDGVVERAIHWVRTGMKLDFDVEFAGLLGLRRARQRRAIAAGADEPDPERL